MRYLFIIFVWLVAFHAYPQSSKTTILSAIVVDNDSVPVQGVAVINTCTLKVVCTDSKGFLETEISGNDSFFSTMSTFNAIAKNLLQMTIW